jgi:hypothetical protein
VADRYQNPHIVSSVAPERDYAINLSRSGTIEVSSSCQPSFILALDIECVPYDWMRMSLRGAIMTAVLNQTFSQIVDQFTDLPSWLAFSGDVDNIAGLLRTSVPECVSGALTLRAGPFTRLALKDKAGYWTGTYGFDVVGSDQASQALLLEASLFAPNLPLPTDIDAPATAPFGNPGWRMWFPETRLLLTYQHPEQEWLPELPLADPDQAQPLIERVLQQQAEGYADVQIQSCAVSASEYEPGATVVYRYQLTYPAAQTNQPRHNMIFGKYFPEDDKDKAEEAYLGLRRLWHSPLADGTAVTMPEPLGYMPEFRTVLQGTVPEECNLEDIEREAVQSNDPAAWDKLTNYVRKAAIGLAALHQSGVQHTKHFAVKKLRGNVTKQIEYLSAPFPELMEGIGRILAQVDDRLAATPADAEVPSHGSFRPEQILINGEQIGFIDFDRASMSEPSYDVYRFRTELMDYGCSVRHHHYPDQATIRYRMAQLATINEIFLQTYESLAPISRQRLVVWETLSPMKEVLLTWSKARLEDRTGRIMMLQEHLQALGIIDQ